MREFHFDLLVKLTVRDLARTSLAAQLDDGIADISYRLEYTFTGSLTTPPCSEDVRWFVLKHPTTISAEEIQRFSQLYRDDARPTQPLYDRVVLESQ